MDDALITESQQLEGVEKKALSDADLKAYIEQSYRMIAGKLTRKTKAELGLAL